MDDEQFLERSDSNLLQYGLVFCLLGQFLGRSRSSSMVPNKSLQMSYIIRPSIEGFVNIIFVVLNFILLNWGSTKQLYFFDPSTSLGIEGFVNIIFVVMFVWIQLRFLYWHMLAYLSIIWNTISKYQHHYVITWLIIS